MKKLILVIFLFSFSLIYSQKGAEQISINFENASKLDVIKKIESQTNYKFFFIEKWLDNETISKNYNNATLRFILNDIFSGSVINYYISSDNKIILTQNNYIYDKLPDDFFGKKKVETIIEEKSKPVFYTEKASSKKSGIETIRIGKESENSRESRYTLSGYVKNSKTNEPIPNLVLAVLNKNINTISDIDGYYSLRIPVGANTLEIKALGIENLKKKIIIYSDGTYNFILEENLELLDEVILDADKDKNVKEAITGITQIQVKDIKTIPLVLGERDVLKVATTLPGISTAGEGSAGFNVRGGKADQNLMLLDNAVIYNPTHFFGIFSALNPYTTGTLDIYKGSIPAQYGGRLSSVFDITTKNGNNQKFSGEGAIGPVTSNLTLEIPVVKDKSALIIGGRGTYSDWILKSIDDEALNNSEASFYDAIVKYNHKINDNNNIETTGYFSKDIFSISSDSTYNYSNMLFSLKWDHQFNEKNKGSLILANSNYEFNIEFDGNSNRNFDLGYTVQETEVKLLMNYLHNDKHSFNYGLSSKLYNNQPGNIKPKGPESIIIPTDIQKERALESALFISDNFNISKNLLINAGLRYSFYAFLGETSQNIYIDDLPKNEGTLVKTEDYKKNEIVKTYGGPEVRVSARYSFTPSFSIKASYNNNYQFIHTLTTNTTASPTDTWKLSDLNIKPQRANQYSFGLFKNINGNDYELSLEGYYKLSENILDYKVGADLLLNENIETEVLQGEGKAYGIELLIRKNKGKLNGWIGYTYSRSLIKLDSEFSEERVNSGDYFPSNYDKPHDFSLIANYKLTKRYSFSMNFIYQTGRPVTYPVGNYVFNNSEYVFYSNRNEFRIPDYYRLDLGINIEGNHKIKKFAHSFWNISVYNVLGRNNPYSVFFVTENGEIKAYQSSIFSVPVPTITYNFKF
ncbi:MAG: TonB-dependent receptor plug domain-containing protein [Flavobacteriaceae bacterium]|nr:TonB-dependent receptor plug domain-containing protein [Flavobacteriaceae bacterium]